MEYKDEESKEKTKHQFYQFYQEDQEDQEENVRDLDLFDPICEKLTKPRNDKKGSASIMSDIRPLLKRHSKDLQHELSIILCDIIPYLLSIRLENKNSPWSFVLLYIDPNVGDEDIVLIVAISKTDFENVYHTTLNNFINAYLESKNPKKYEDSILLLYEGEARLRNLQVEKNMAILEQYLSLV